MLRAFTGEHWRSGVKLTKRQTAHDLEGRIKAAALAPGRQSQLDSGVPGGDPVVLTLLCPSSSLFAQPLPQLAKRTQIYYLLLSWPQRGTGFTETFLQLHVGIWGTWLLKWGSPESSTLRPVWHGHQFSNSNRSLFSVGLPLLFPLLFPGYSNSHDKPYKKTSAPWCSVKPCFLPDPSGCSVPF